MQLTLEQLVVSVLGGGATISIAALGFFLKSTFSDIKKELTQLNVNVTQLIVQGSNSSLRHERTEAEVTNIRQRIHHLENVVTQVSLVQQRCDACNGRE
jgi:virulence-associated protein VapD